MKGKEEERISEIHHNAVTIAQQAFLCMQQKRVGREWLLKIKHAHERIGLMISKLEKAEPPVVERQSLLPKDGCKNTSDGLHRWKFIGTDRGGSHKGEDLYQCVHCKESEYNF